MKRILTLALYATPLLCYAVRAPIQDLRQTAVDKGWSEQELERFDALVEAYDATRRAAVTDRQATVQKEETVDPVLEALRQDAKRRKARFEVLKRTQTAYEPGRTNLNVRAMRASLAEKIAEARQGWTNATLRIERMTAALDERRAEYVAKRDAAPLPTTKALYQAFIDAIDRIKEKMDGK